MYVVGAVLEEHDPWEKSDDVEVPGVGYAVAEAFVNRDGEGVEDGEGYQGPGSDGDDLGVEYGGESWKEGGT